MIRRPPRSPLFPYTTPSRSPVAPDREQGNATRSRADCCRRQERRTKEGAGPFPGQGRLPDQTSAPAGGAARSEEHTSELQSHLNLVCRLLLEKKKKPRTREH